MIDFLFLGIIPGTHVQITFAMWLTTLAVFVTTWAISYTLLRVRPFRKLRLTASIYLASWQARRLNPQA